MAMALAAPLFAQQEVQADQSAPEAVNQIEDPKAKAVVDDMYNAYLNCKTYTDSGIVTSGDSIVEFSTSFRRPGGLLIKFAGKNFVRTGQFVLWISGEQKKIEYTDFNGQQAEESAWPTDTWSEDVKLHRKDLTLSFATSAFTGISLGATTNVPQMLFPGEVTGREYGQIKDLVYQGTEDDRGVECDVLSSEKEGEKIWIDKSTHLLRHTYKESLFLGERFVFDTLYSPHFDTTVTDDSLSFDPPK